MKLPLWVWDKNTETYKVFPLHLLTLYPDGKYGLNWPVFIGTHHNEEIKEFFRHYYHCFVAEKDVRQDKQGLYQRYVLKDETTTNSGQYLEL